ncbi:acyltransferase family protein [Dyadobacter sp. CY347]|uniref:acyltransferase family protein n=1 Tax=Dyadobacter sp. CY347 TaxID=2909336 RepID=UPI001F478F6E|nr:heparan-alpha-glucosaminide N-acetyltransferase domain-containing protein [Dyadobacter sp. CY347]MCF2490043.1 heparan-alpha-glucosaminide N-acetyltransferase domain-containing protein [Dyadobacter sp. CY347]
MKQRLVSLDVLRGLTIILMTIVNNPGDWGNVYAPLLHAEWHGCTPTDLVFPTFLFIVGVSIVLATPQKTWNVTVLQRIVTRALRIFCLGLFSGFFIRIQMFGLDGLPLLVVRLVITAIIVMALFADYDKNWQFLVAFFIFLVMMILAFGGFEPFNTVRIPGVLQRIAVVYLIASLLYLRTGWVTQAVVGGVILLVYWAFMTLIPVPEVGEANLEKGTNLAAWLDNLLLPGHLWATSKTWDPEGILSTLPAIGTGIAGLLTGTLLRTNFDRNQKATYLLIGGIAAIVVGWGWSFVFPLNKALWTSSFVLYAAGWALVCLAILYFVIDVKGYAGWTTFLVIFGVNPMVVFFFSGMIFRVLNAVKIDNPADPASGQMDLVPYLYKYQIVPVFANPMNASLAYALLYLALWFVILWLLYRNRLVFKV